MDPIQLDALLINLYALIVGAISYGSAPSSRLIRRDWKFLGGRVYKSQPVN